MSLQDLERAIEIHSENIKLATQKHIAEEAA